jgi:hypothetical protein
MRKANEVPVPNVDALERVREWLTLKAEKEPCPACHRPGRKYTLADALEYVVNLGLQTWEQEERNV